MPIKILKFRKVRCAGCGKLGTMLCDHCLELYRATKERIKKLEGTVKGTLALRGRFHW